MSKSIKTLLAGSVAWMAAAAFPAEEQELAVLSASVDLGDMALGECTSGCAVMGIVGGELVQGIKTDQGHTVLAFIEAGDLRELLLPLPNFDREFLDAVDTGDCVADCIAFFLLDDRWIFVHRDSEGRGIVRATRASSEAPLSRLPHPSTRIGKSADTAFTNDECPHSVTKTIVECGCYKDPKDTDWMIMKFIARIEIRDCNGVLIDLDYLEQEIGYPASSGCLCRYF